MDKSEIEKRVIEWIETEFPGNVEIKRETRFLEDLGINDTLKVMLVLDYEEEFGVEIPHNEEDKWRMVGDVVDYIDGLLNPPHTST